MKESKIALVCAAALAASFLAGCKTVEHTVARFSVVSTKNVDISNLGNFKRSHDKITFDLKNKQDKKAINKITLFSDKKLDDNYVVENALDYALEKIPGATVLVDAKLKYIVRKRPFSKMYGYVFEGTALIDPSVAGETAEADFDDEELFFVEEDGVERKVSEEEYYALLASL